MAGAVCCSALVSRAGQNMSTSGQRTAACALGRKLPGWLGGRHRLAGTVEGEGQSPAGCKAQLWETKELTSLCRRCSSRLPLGPDQVDLFVCFYENMYLWKSFRFRVELLAVAGVRVEGGCLALGVLRAVGGRGSSQKGRRPDQSSGPRRWPCGALGFLLAGVMGGLGRRWEGAEHPTWPCHLLRGDCLHS